MLAMISTAATIIAIWPLVNFCCLFFTVMSRMEVPHPAKRTEMARRPKVSVTQEAYIDELTTGTGCGWVEPCGARRIPWDYAEGRTAAGGGHEGARGCRRQAPSSPRAAAGNQAIRMATSPTAIPTTVRSARCRVRMDSHRPAELCAQTADANCFI